MLSDTSVTSRGVCQVGWVIGLCHYCGFYYTVFVYIGPFPGNQIDRASVRKHRSMAKCMAWGDHIRLGFVINSRYVVVVYHFLFDSHVPSVLLNS